jgi:hypothetical protein
MPAKRGPTNSPSLKAQAPDLGHPNRIPNTPPLHARSVEIGSNRGLATILICSFGF